MNVCFYIECHAVRSITVKMGELTELSELTCFVSNLNETKDSSYMTTGFEETLGNDCNASTSDKVMKLSQCLKANIECYAVLNLIESVIIELLENCNREQRVLDFKIRTTKFTKRRKLCSARRAETYIRKTFQMPYFKDVDGFSHCYNEDVSKRETLGFLNLQHGANKSCLWTKQEKEIVINCITKEEKSKWIQTLQRCGLLHLKNVEEMTLSELVESRFAEYDWFKLSVSDLNNAHSPQECRFVWINCLHPQINQDEWTEEENERLKRTSEKYNFQDWQKIALDLGTRRSAYQCIVQFKRCIDSDPKVEWNDDEIGTLKEIVSSFCVLKYIPWHKIKVYFDGRSNKEIALQWKIVNSDGISHKFSLEEDIVLVAGMRVFGSDYTRIVDYLPDRSVCQVRGRITALMNRQFPKKRWKRCDDVLLIDLVKKYGFGNWLKISMHFVNRDPISVRERYVTLLRNSEKYGSSHCSRSAIVRTPRSKVDIVNVKMLWEAAQSICIQNKLMSDSDCILSMENHGNVVSKLSALLKPVKRQGKMIEKHKLVPIVEHGFIEFFRPTFLNFIECRRRSNKAKLMIPTQVHDLIISLKLLKVNAQLTSMKKVRKDTSLSGIDKNLLRYIFTKRDKLLRTNENKSPFEDRSVISCNVDSRGNISNSTSSQFLFPPNSSTLIALRTLLLHHKSLKLQKEGLTMQLDNTEYKYARNSMCALQCPKYGEGYKEALDLWNDRIKQLLYWTSFLTSYQKQ